MKLATYRDGSRDGRLMIVSRDFSRATPAPGVTTLQAALDSWDAVSPALEERYAALNAGQVAGTMAFIPQECMAPLPRAFQWADGSAYVNHVELVRRARGADMPPSFWTDPLMYQGGSDDLLGPTDPIELADPDWGCDLEAEIAVITGDVAAGISPQAAAETIRLLVLVNDVSLRNLIPGELAKGFGFFQSKPASAFSACAITPDELGAAWDGKRVHRPLTVHVNAQLFGQPEAGEDMIFDFPTLIAHAARTRHLCAGSIIGSGTVSNRGADGGPGLPIAANGKGYACIAEQRTVETLLTGQAQTPWLQHGDHVQIEMFDAQGHSIFGAIDQMVQAPTPH